MEKNAILKKWGKVCLLVLCVFCVISLFAQLWGLHINPLVVDRIELYTYDHKYEGRVELSEQEAWKAMLLSNLSLPAGEVIAEPCCDSYRLEVYFRTGAKTLISEGTHDKLIVSANRHYVSNQWLIDYILELVEKYDLPID